MKQIFVKSSDPWAIETYNFIWNTNIFSAFTLGVAFSDKKAFCIFSGSFTIRIGTVVIKDFKAKMKKNELISSNQPEWYLHRFLLTTQNIYQLFYDDLEGNNLSHI